MDYGKLDKEKVTNLGKIESRKSSMLRVTHRKGGVWNHETVDIMRVVESSRRLMENRTTVIKRKRIIGNTNVCVSGTILKVLNIFNPVSLFPFHRLGN